MLPVRVAWAIAVITIVCRSALSTIVALLLWSVLPNFVGFQTTTVMSGSMEPRMQVGDAIIARHVDAAGLARGQVLLFDDPDHPGMLRMHRLVGIRTDGQLVTKGDANEHRDSSTVGFDAVHGAAFLRIPYAGLPNYWLRTGQMLPLAGGSALVLALMGGIRLGRLLEDEEERERRRHRGIRLPGMHRATAAGAVLLVLGGGVVAPPAEAHAAYSATSTNGIDAWATMCGDVPPSTGATPSLYYGYGTSSVTTVTDLSAVGNSGTLRSGASIMSCSGGSSPYATFNGSSGIVNSTVLRSHPGAVTIATWFRVSPGNAGGVLADFGNSNVAAASSGVDDALYMGDSGKLSFTAASVQLASLIQGGYVTCTTAQGYADGAWHLVVASMGSTGCSITIDATPSTTSSTASGLALAVGAYSGYWRFGYETAASGTFPNAPTRKYFLGDLDETQVYDSAITPPTAALPGVQGTIFAAGH